MERKIGEIFEYNGEWYQTVEAPIDEHSCNGCQGCKGTGGPHIFGGECNGNARKDNKFVIFKKLEKVGEPFTGEVHIQFQRYKIYTEPIINSTENIGSIDEGNTIAIEIKQTKEDMEEKKLHLKPFDLDAAKQGKPVCTRDGCKARIICFDRKDNTPIVALIERVDGIEILQCFYNDGKCFHDSTSDNDLMMLPEKKEGWVNVYKNQIHDTPESAVEGHKGITDYIKTIRVEWEE